MRSWTDSCSARREESNDMCFVAVRMRGSYHSIRLDRERTSPSFETHIVRFVSMSWTRICHLRIDWLRSLRDIVVLLLRMRSCPIRAQSFWSSRIKAQLVETNRTRCVSSLGDASFQRYRRFRLRMRRFAIRSCRACAEVKRRYLGNEASPSDETHLIRFVSTFCTWICQLRKDWGRIGQLRMRSRKTTISRTDLN